MAKKEISVSRPCPTRLPLKLWKHKGIILKEPRTKMVRAAKIRKSLTPGTVVILLAGPYRGRRVVMLKSLQSGLIVTTGPHRLNRIPLRRVSPKFVIATSTKLSLSTCPAIDSITDEFFGKTREKKNEIAKQKRRRKKAASTGADDGNAFMVENQQEADDTKLPDWKKEEQTRVDDCVAAAIKAHSDSSMLEKYLKSRFYLQRGDYPHLMKF